MLWVGGISSHRKVGHCLLKECCQFISAACFTIRIEFWNISQLFKGLEKLGQWSSQKTYQIIVQVDPKAFFQAKVTLINFWDLVPTTRL